MDPLSIIAGVTGTVTFGVQASRKLMTLQTPSRRASEEVRSVSQDVEALSKLLAALGGYLKDDVIYPAAVANLQLPLDNCTKLSKVFGTKLRAIRRLRVMAQSPSGGVSRGISVKGT
jgi:hypothetical protein